MSRKCSLCQWCHGVTDSQRYRCPHIELTQPSHDRLNPVFLEGVTSEFGNIITFTYTDSELDKLADSGQQDH